MKDYLGIKNVSALEVLDSRGNPTVQVEVITEGGFCGRAIVPSGASTGSFEAVELRDGDTKRYNGKGVLNVVDNVNKKIAKDLIDMNVYEQAKIDEKLINLDGTKNKSKLGANAILAVSMAVCKAAAESLGMSLYNYIGGINSRKMPVPMMNILNGGKHSENNVSIQEFMIMPINQESFSRSLQMCSEIYKSLKDILKSEGYSVGVGDEGGFAPDLKSEEEAIEKILQAVKNAGYVPGRDIGIALDIAATEMIEEASKQGKEGYLFWKTGDLKNSFEMIEYLEGLVNKYPIISIEDGLGEEDWGAWKALTERLGNKIQLVGDDLFVTNIERLKKGVSNKIANAILIKPNQIGTVTETLETIDYAKQNGYKVIISHRSGETEDTTIADLAVGINSMQIKSGAPCRTDRVSKYNRLLNIENEL